MQPVGQTQPTTHAAVSPLRNLTQSSVFMPNLIDSKYSDALRKTDNQPNIEAQIELDDLKREQQHGKLIAQRQQKKIQQQTEQLAELMKLTSTNCFEQLLQQVKNTIADNKRLQADLVDVKQFKANLAQYQQDIELLTTNQYALIQRDQLLQMYEQIKSQNDQINCLTQIQTEYEKEHCLNEVIKTNNAELKLQNENLMKQLMATTRTGSETLLMQLKQQSQRILQLESEVTSYKLDSQSVKIGIQQIKRESMQKDSVIEELQGQLMQKNKEENGLMQRSALIQQKLDEIVSQHSPSPQRNKAWK